MVIEINRGNGEIGLINANPGAGEVAIGEIKPADQRIGRKMRKSAIPACADQKLIGPAKNLALVGELHRSAVAVGVKGLEVGLGIRGGTSESRNWLKAHICQKRRRAG